MIRWGTTLDAKNESGVTPGFHGLPGLESETWGTRQVERNLRLSLDDLESVLGPPCIFLILGGIFLSAAVLWTYTGEAWVPFNGWVYRAQEPRWSWWQVVVCFLGGACFVVRFLYEVFGPAN